MFHNKTSEQVRPDKKKQPEEPEEAVYDVKNVDQGFAGQPSSLTACNSKCATQTMSSYTEGSQQSSEQLRSLGEDVELVQLSSLTSPNSIQSVTDTAPDVLDENELLPMLEVKATDSEGSQQSSEELRPLSGEVELVQLSSLPSPNSLQSTTDTAPDHLDVSELLPKAEPVGTRSISSQTSLQSASDSLDLNEELPLTLQQREAIGRRHHLKFITGHYGSGKVTVS